MKEQLSTALSLLACLLAALCLFSVRQLDARLTRLSDQLTDTVRDSAVTAQNNILSSLDTHLQDSSSLLLDRDWSLGTPDYESGTVPLRCEVTLRRYETDAALTLQALGQSWPMTPENGRWQTTFPIPLAGETVIEQLQLTAGGAVETEILQWSISPRPWLLPEISSSFEGESSGRKGDDRYFLRLNGTVFLSLVRSKGQEGTLRSAELVERIDGAEQSRQPLPPLTEESELSVNRRPETTPLRSDLTAEHYALNINRELQIPFGCTHELTVEMVDENGLTYLSHLDSIQVAKDGTITRPKDVPELAVLAPNGARLFE
ncbi:MAG: hypothetical protein IJC43_01385 [Clostridia bacterium]|nr:hypothetical protein [Clostridia bacterium]